MTSQPGLRLPITGSFALPFTAYYIFLSARVVAARLKQGIAIGDQTPSPSSSFTTTTTSGGIHTTRDPLRLAARAQQNFAEYVPLALILAGTAELNGGAPHTLRAALSALLACRVLHAELGIMAADAMGYGRPVGFYGTLGVMAWLGGWGAWLGLG
ncbi:membrane-associated, eicosanoid/glutathione metabolism protein [Jackrogersella minutella]|nr:membrane-associated, eicosanoid/glutathione metabolism protein [Jackrogersella minutella]